MEPLDFPSAALDVGLKLAFVVALIYILAAVWRRYGTTLGIRQGARTLEILESATLAPNRQVFLVRVSGQRILLGVTASQIGSLAQWDDPPVGMTEPADSHK